MLVHTHNCLPPILPPFIPSAPSFLPLFSSLKVMMVLQNEHQHMYICMCAHLCVYVWDVRVSECWIFFFIEWMNEQGAQLVWYWEGTTKVPNPMPHFPLIIPHGLAWDWIQASLMRGQQLTAQAKHGLAVNIKIMTFWDVQPCTPVLVVRYQATFWTNMVLPCSVLQMQAEDLFWNITTNLTRLYGLASQANVLISLQLSAKSYGP